MSKRDMRARRLLAAVLLAMSVQVWYAQPLWAAQPDATTTATETTAAGNSADTTAKTENTETTDKTANTETDKTDNTEATTKPVADATPIGYSSRSASPMAASDGDISTFGSESSNMTSYGLNARATGNYASAFGNNAQASGYASAFGSGAQALGSAAIAFGNGTVANQDSAIAFGNSAKAQGTHSIAFGGYASANSQDGIAVGWRAYTSSTGTVALGVNASAGNQNSVAIGANSYTNASNQVAFGNMSNITTYRNLAGIGNIAMTGALTADRGTIKGALSAGSISIDGSGHISGVDLIGGALTGVISINGVTVADSSAATGLTIGSNYDSKVTIGSSTNALSSTGFSVNNAGALTATSGTIGGVGLSSGVLTGVTKINGADLKVGPGGDSEAVEAYMSMAFGVGATYTKTEAGKDPKDARYSTAFGASAAATGNFSNAFGYNAQATGNNSSAFGYNAQATVSGGSAFGKVAKAEGANSSAFGVGSNATGSHSVALGSIATAGNADSVAIGFQSSTSADYQVSFGTAKLNTTTSEYEWTNLRSLDGIKNITLHTDATGGGELIGVTKINGVTVAGSSAATGLTFGGNAVIGKTDTPFSSTGFSVNNSGALTAASVTASGGLTIDANNAFTTNSLKVGGQTVSGDNLEAVAKLSYNTTDGVKINGNVTTAGAINGVGIGVKGGAAADKDNVVLTQGANTIDLTKMNSDVSDVNVKTTNISYVPATGTTVDGVVIKSGVVSGVSTINGIGIDANRNLTNVGKINGIDLASLGGSVDFGNITTTIATKASAAVGAATTFSVDNATGNITTVGTINGVGIGTKGGAAADKDNVVLTQGVNTIDITKMNSDVNGLNTATTNISYDTGTGTTVDGVVIKSGVVSGVTSIAMNGKITGVTAGTANSDAVNVGQMNTALTGKADASTLASYATTAVMDTKLAAKADANATGLSTENKTAWKGALGVDTLASDVAGKASQTDFTALNNIVTATDTGLVAKTAALKTATTGMTYVGTVGSEMTTFAGGVTANSFTVKVGATNYGMAADGTLTAKSIMEGGTALSDTYAAKSALDAKADVSVLANYATTTAMNTALGDYAKTDAMTSAIGTAKTELTKAFGDADTKIRTDFAAADTSLKNDLNIEIGKNTTAVGKLETATTGMTYVGTVGSEMTTFAGGVTAGSFTVGATGFGFSATGDMTAKTVNGVSISGSDTAAVVGTVNINELKAAVETIKHDGVGTTDTAGIKRTGDGSATPYTTTIEGTLKVGTDGTIANKDASFAVNSTGELTAAKINNVTVGAAGISGTDTFNGITVKKVGTGSNEIEVGGVNLSTLETTVGDSTSGLVKTTADLKALVGDNDSGLVKDIADMDIAYKAADTALAGRTGKLETATTGMTYNATSGAMTTFAGGVTAGSFTVNVGGTDYGMSSTGALSALSITEAGKTLTEKYADKGNTFTKEEVTNAISAATSGIPSDETVKTIQGTIAGIKRTGDAGTGYTTTIENNTAITTAGVAVTGTLSATGAATFGSGAATTVITGGNVTAKGTVTAAEFVEGDKKLAEKYAGISDAYTAEKAALKADKTYVDNNFAKTAAVNTELGKKVDLSAYNSQIGTLEAADSDLAGRAGKLEKATTGMTYDATSGAMTTFAGGVTANSLTIGSVTVKAGELGGLTKLNNAAISVDGKGITIDGVGLKDLDARLAEVENNPGTGGGGSEYDDTNVKGIKRTGVDASGKGTTTIEDATSFTASGMKTSNLVAATAQIGGIDFAANGVMTNVASINGISFAGGKVNGVDVGALKSSVDSLGTRVTNIENSGGGGGSNPGAGGANTGGITRPDGDKTTIEGSTTIDGSGLTTNNVNSDSITVAGGKENQTVINEDGIVVAKGETNQVTINKDGIHVGQNSSVMNDVDGFISDKGLYIGVASSGDTSTAKFSVDKVTGTMTSNVGGHSLTNSGDGTKFTDSSGTTTIQGNKVTTGQMTVDELWVGGNKVNVSGGTIGQTNAVDNHLTATKDGYDYTNDFTTTETEGTTQSSSKVEMDSATDPLNPTPTGNSESGSLNTKYDGITQEVNKVTNEGKNTETTNVTTTAGGMDLTHTTTEKDSEGKTTSTIGKTEMTGDSITVGKTTVDADGKETSSGSTTVGSGEVTLNREDGSSIRVGDAIEGLQSDVQEMGSRINEMGTEIKEVGALSAALAGLHPQPQNANTKADFAMAMGSYEGKQALAVGAFYKPDKRTMLSVGASTTSSKHMMNMGISIALDRMPEAERKAQEQAIAAGKGNDILAERMKKLEDDYEARLQKMEAAYEARLARLEASYQRQQADSKAEQTASKAEQEAVASEVQQDEASADEQKTA